MVGEKMLSIDLCDDEEQVRLNVKEILYRMYTGDEIEITEFASGQQLLLSCEQRNQTYDVAILDIEMPELDGIQVAKELRQMERDMQFIMLTSHAEYAVQGYELSIFRYLLKPLEEEKLFEAIQQIMQRKETEHVLYISSLQNITVVKLSHILYIEANNQDIIIVTKNDRFQIRGNISDYEKRLKQDGFYRIHRGYLVNVMYIKQVRKLEILLDNNEVLMLSRLRKKEFLEFFYTYIKKVAI